MPHIKVSTRTLRGGLLAARTVGRFPRKEGSMQLMLWVVGWALLGLCALAPFFLWAVLA